LDAIDAVEGLLEPLLDGLGYALVRVQLSGNATQTLQIMAERNDDAEMTVEDCAEISRTVSALLDVEDPIAGAYTLEVSSPGLDRPLVRLDDYVRFSGREARVETRQVVDGHKRFKGRLAGVRGQSVLIACEGAEREIPFDAVLRGKLLLTDELISAAMKGRSG
jgi:ribosome maturation factor RimP